jgi:hypothetical protein
VSEADEAECITLRSNYVLAGSRGRSLHWVICCRRPGGKWELWAGSETRQDVERIREGMLERRPKLKEWEWSLVGPGGV